MLRASQAESWTEEVTLKGRIPEVDQADHGFELELHNGIKTTNKTYYILTRHGNGVRVAEANKAVAAKAAKGCQELGQAIDVCEGRAKLVTAASRDRIGYKLVTRDDGGRLVSVWDGSAWDIGVTRIEAATSDHTGGYYYYASEQEAIEAAARSDVFDRAREHANLVLVEVRVSGRESKKGCSMPQKTPPCAASTSRVSASHTCASRAGMRG